MSAYIVADIDITDAELYEQYKPLASAAIEKYGARPLVRGGVKARAVRQKASKSNLIFVKGV